MQNVGRIVGEHFPECEEGDFNCIFFIAFDFLLGAKNGVSWNDH